MKKLLLPLMAVLIAACSPDNGNDDNNTIDPALIGKWKVEYSKTIKPAIYILDEADLEKFKDANPDLKVGLNYQEDAWIYEYFGNYGEIGATYESGMFDQKEIEIEIRNDNFIIVRAVLKDNKNISYKIDGGYLKYQIAFGTPVGIIKYYFEDEMLVMELVDVEKSHLTSYTISKYSKIK